MDWNLGTGARTAWQEARDQADDGQRGVCHAIVNRWRSGRWGKTLHEVCTSEWHGIYQFTGWTRGNPNRAPACHVADDDPLLKKLAGFITEAINGAEDPTGGATHYYNPDVADMPLWVFGDKAKGVPPATFCCRIGAHLFYRDVR